MVINGSYMQATALHVDITEVVTIQRVHDLGNSLGRPQRAHRQLVRDQGVVAGRAVHHGAGTGDGTRLTCVQRLPHPVDAVQHRMMEEKDRVVDARVQVG